MFVQWFWRKRMAKVAEAFEARDADRLAALWPDDFVLEFPPGTPMAGEWRGRSAATEIMRAIFAHNASMRLTVQGVAIDHPWSPTGTFKAFVEWAAVARSVDGHVLTGTFIMALDFRRWKAVRNRDHFFDVPGIAAHYAGLQVPSRQTVA